MDNSFHLESLSACHDANSELIMYFMVNTAYVNYLDQIDNLTESQQFPILKNMTTFEQTLPILLNISKFDTPLITSSKTLKDFIHQYKCKKKIFDLKERHDNMDENWPNKDFFSNNFIVDVFSVYCCNNFTIGHSFGNIFTVQTWKTQNISDQSCFTKSKRNRHINNTERCHHDM